MKGRNALHLFLVLVFVNFPTLKAQESGNIYVIDSLLKFENSFHRDTSLVVQYNIKAYEIIQNGGHVDSSLKYTDLALSICKKTNWRKGFVITYFTISELDNVKGRYFSLINNALKVLTYADKNSDWQYYAFCLRSVGGAYLWLEKPKEALEYYNSFFSFSKNRVNQKFSTVHSKSLKTLSTTINDAYTEIGIVNIKLLNEGKKALENFEIASKRYAAIKDSFGLAYLGSYKALALEKFLRNKEAETGLDFSINYLKNHNGEYLLGDAYNNASQYYLKLKNFDKAEEYALLARNIAEKTGVFFSIRDANKILYEINKADGRYKDALEHHILYSAIKDSMSEVNFEDKMKVIRYEFDTENQKQELEKKILENQKKNYLIYSLLFGMVAALVIGFIVIRNMNYKRKLTEKEMERLQQERQLLATNSVLKGQEEERSRLARDLHDGLGGLLSGIKLNLSSIPGNVVLSNQNAQVFSKTITQLDNAITELRRVAHSMLPESLLKFGLKDAISDYCEGINQAGKLKIHFQTFGLDGFNLEQSTEITLYRIIQELLNNVIKHAEASEAFVQIVRTEGTLTITVEDDGKGFDSSKLRELKGIGINNIENRVEYLKGKMEIQTESGKGTSTIIEIKV
ncbi:sensor histidine kinase [Lacihabitans sp. LS3-19]|uniref:sensor histidine kinase n=1 Tax=Lacihabitans sp. LS3-19 TaxID=2487335 RepID=UPI0020CDCEC1|nr:sensor histidine kinase [Lacihabitans sp. LS3-19]MCP9770720.1 sensor histidine kinase [Lacihabitans sp. LS3-19]